MTPIQQLITTLATTFDPLSPTFEDDAPTIVNHLIALAVEYNALSGETNTLAGEIDAAQVDITAKYDSIASAGGLYELIVAIYDAINGTLHPEVLAAHADIFDSWMRSHVDLAALNTYLTAQSITPDAGDWYYDQTAKEVRFYDGTSSWANGTSIVGTLASLLTADKSSAVAAINETLSLSHKTLTRNVLAGDVTVGKATITLTAEENKSGRIVITDDSPLTTVSCELIIGSAQRALTVVNNDDQDWKVWIGSGGFITVLAGKTAHLYCDGVNVGYMGGTQNQKLTDITGLRTKDVDYLNDSGQTIYILMTASPTTDSMNVYIDNVWITAFASNNRGYAFFPVPHGSEWRWNTVTATPEFLFELS